MGAHIGLNPAPWFTRLTVEPKGGERVDVEADRSGSGVDGLIEANLRGSLGGWGIESEQKIAFARIERAGRRVISDSTARWLGVLHLSAHDSVRAVWQAARWRREADTALGIAAARFDGRSTSIVFQHRVGLGRNFSVGATRASEAPGARRSDELFVKAAFLL